VKKIKISSILYNIIVGIYPLISPFNFIWAVFEWGIKEAIIQEKENFEEFVRVWRNWRGWIRK